MIPLLVNKTHPLPENYLDGVELIETENCKGKKAFVEKKTFEAYQKLRDALSKQGVLISFGSNFRTIEEQKEVIRRLTEKYGEAYAEKTAAPPGTSEHHTGMALDLAPMVSGEWVTENMALMKPVGIWEKVHEALPKFGFILRYPKGKEEITGYGYEPWHIRYVGRELAEKVYQSGLCLEEFLERKHFLQDLSRRYPQLSLPVADDTRYSEIYRNTVLRGEEPVGEPAFTFSEEDRLETVSTPAGEVEVIYLRNREDFEHCIRALAYRCENREIPPTTGASTISGLINWEKIRKHREEYTAAGGKDWDREFEHFTADRKNYRDTVIVLSHGYYSAVTPEEAGFPEEEWVQLSYTIRKYHELAHFVSRTLYPENREAVRDEVLADMNGILAALGHFDADLAGRFLGVRNGKYTGGRLENYVDKEKLSAAAGHVCDMISYLEKNCTGSRKPFEYLLELEKGRVLL